MNESLGANSSSEQAQSHSERRKRSYSAEVSRDVSIVVDRDCGGVESVSQGTLGLSESLLEQATFEIETTDLSCSESSVDEISVNDDEDVVVARNNGSCS